MIRKNQRQLNWINAFSDGVLVLLSYLFASWLWLDVVRQGSNMAGLENWYSGMGWAAALYAVCTVLILHAMKVYRTTRIKKRHVELRNICLGNALALIIVAAGLYLFRLQDFSRGVLGVFYLTVCTTLLGKRIVLRALLRRMRSKGYNLKHILVVGNGTLAQRYVEAVAADETLGIRVREMVPVGVELIPQLEKRLSNQGIDEVILALAPEEIGVTIPVIQQCEKSGVKMSIVPFYNDVIPTRPTVDLVGDMKLIQLRTTPLDEPINSVFKRGFDILASIIGLIILSPLLLVLALLVKLSSPGPVLFRQERVGRNKKNFQMLKFRSMKVNAEQDTAWSKAGDNRRTWIGSFMRKVSIDELPQLINVLKGDMSLVGPRPEIPHFVEQFAETVPLYMVRNQVRPGITGWAQVNGLRGDTSIPDRIKHDLWYIENWSFGLDMKILFMTVFGGMVNGETVGICSEKGQNV